MDCKNCQKADQACVPYFLHEGAMMHKDKDNKRMMIIILALCITLIVVVVTLVSYYTTRTAMWNDTIARLETALVEVCNAKGVTPP